MRADARVRALCKQFNVSSSRQVESIRHPMCACDLEFKSAHSSQCGGRRCAMNGVCVCVCSIVNMSRGRRTFLRARQLNCHTRDYMVVVEQNQYTPTRESVVGCVCVCVCSAGLVCGRRHCSGNLLRHSHTYTLTNTSHACALNYICNATVKLYNTATAGR